MKLLVLPSLILTQKVPKIPLPLPGLPVVTTKVETTTARVAGPTTLPLFPTEDPVASDSTPMTLIFGFILVAIIGVMGFITHQKNQKRTKMIAHQQGSLIDLSQTRDANELLHGNEVIRPRPPIYFNKDSDSTVSINGSELNYQVKPVLGSPQILDPEYTMENYQEVGYGVQSAYYQGEMHVQAFHTELDSSFGLRKRSYQAGPEYQSEIGNGLSRGSYQAGSEYQSEVGSIYMPRNSIYYSDGYQEQYPQQYQPQQYSYPDAGYQQQYNNLATNQHYSVPYVQQPIHYQEGSHQQYPDFAPNYQKENYSHHNASNEIQNITGHDRHMFESQLDAAFEVSTVITFEAKENVISQEFSENRHQISVENEPPKVISVPESLAVVVEDCIDTFDDVSEPVIPETPVFVDIEAENYSEENIMYEEDTDIEDQELLIDDKDAQEESNHKEAVTAIEMEDEFFEDVAKEIFVPRNLFEEDSGEQELLIDDKDAQEESNHKEAVTAIEMEDESLDVAKEIFVPRNLLEEGSGEKKAEEKVAVEVDLPVPEPAQIYTEESEPAVLINEVKVDVISENAMAAENAIDVNEEVTIKLHEIEVVEEVQAPVFAEINLQETALVPVTFEDAQPSIADAAELGEEYVENTNLVSELETMASEELPVDFVDAQPSSEELSELVENTPAPVHLLDLEETMAYEEVENPIEELSEVDTQEVSELDSQEFTRDEDVESVVDEHAKEIESVESDTKNIDQEPEAVINRNLSFDTHLKELSTDREY
jgi:hypothetical protein